MADRVHPLIRSADKPVEETDPFDAVAMRVPVPDREQGLIDAARCYVEELITMDYTDLMIKMLFRKPFYMGLYPVYKSHGEEFVVNFIAECRAELARTGSYPR